MALEWIQRAATRGARPAIRDADTHTYADLASASARGAQRLLDGAADLAGARVAFLVEPSFAWVATQWAIWRAGGVAVPLAMSHPPAELDYVLSDCEAAIAVAGADLAARLEPLTTARDLRFHTTGGLLADGPAPDALPTPSADDPAMLLYTSGSTGKPKGVLSTHGNIEAQVRTLVEAWGWREDDSILGVLPLHHVHGIINVISCALFAGARCELLPRFDARTVWNRLGEQSLFMAVPTIYRRLIAEWENADEETQRNWSAAARHLRLMVSGSAALPVPTLERWRSIAGHTLLERYGMTEIGMALSNPLQGERRPGFVGTPLPGVEARLVNEAGQPVAPGESGEIQVKGPQVFREYWRRPAETRAAFTEDGWFQTGDVAVVEDDAWRILGRRSVDIIKSGGYKISALEIEDVLRTHPAIAECAVVGVPDEEWGERVCVAVVLESDADLEIEALREWARSRLAPYKIPSRLVARDALPRNALGKVVKPEIRALFAEPVA